ncbi:serine hydrolase [Desertivirga brevis]|uniref:serine hydrolase n=1 Tax=Desertivirga brevis TaxID=2810310 RepID=UPI001A963DA1|nr:serine hydrolase [Pedobacter sp. SYSU D00873]
MTIKVKRMAMGFLLSALLLLVLIAFLTKDKPRDTATYSFTARRQLELTNFVTQLKQDFPVPGIGVALISNDSVFYTSAGLRDQERQAFTVSTPVFSGSLSEPLLATAILKLQEQGKLDLDDAVIKFLPYFKMGGKAYQDVTIRHLLTHTSGIDKYEMIWDTPNLKSNAPEITTRSIASQLPRFAPGTRIYRSPYNYDILADVINKITGKPFEEFTDKEIFSSLGMSTSTFLRPREQYAKPFKISNWLQYSYTQDTLYPYNRENAGSNGFHTSTRDVSRWIQMILNQGWYQKKEVLSTASQKELTKVQFSSEGNKGVAFGFDVLIRDGERVLIKSSHYGGFNSEMILIPERKIGVAVFSNISGFLNISSISSQLAAWLKGEPLVYPKIPVGIALGKKLYQNRKLVDVLKQYEVLKQDSSVKYDCSAEALTQFGQSLLYKIGDRQKAIQLFQYCTMKFPSSVLAHLYLAEAYVQNKNLSQCKKSFAKAKALAGSKGLNQQQAAYIEENILVLEEKKQG